MAEVGRREVVGDPLALNPLAQPADRSLQTSLVRNPGQTGGKLDTSIGDSIASLGNAVSSVLEGKQDEFITEGKLKYIQGVTEDEINKTGNKWTIQGWQALNAADAANRWYADELNALANGANTQDPNEYGRGVMERRKQHLANLPDDPAIRKLYVAAFDDLAPRLTAAQLQANNEYNKQQTTQSFSSLLSSGSYTNSDRPASTGREPLALSPGRVRPVVEGYTDDDIDLMTRAVLGEAAGEGATGQAAVAHTILNRVIDGSYGGRSIKGVVLKPGQFSAFNAETGYIGGKGANNLINIDKNSPAYQSARQIVQHVLSGSNVDPTNGATHYVAGGIRPDWFGAEESKSGGAVRIGGHEFVGKARNLGNSASPSSGVLKFVHKDQTDLSPDFATKLTNAGLALGRDLTITSGYRSPEHNKRVGGAKQSQHTTGNAADIDMSGLNDNERAELVRTLKAQGITRFGTYDNHKDMLHVDTSTANGAQWFMHNKSNSNLSKAPAWFQAVANEPVVQGGSNVAATAGSDPQSVTDLAGIPTSQSVSIAQTQTQDMIRGFNMPQKEKATAVAQELITQLSSGSSALWDNVGGAAFLRELGATPQEIRQVEAARSNYEKEAANKFDLERAKWENGLTNRITTGELSLADAEAEIQKRYDAGALTDSAAYSLVAKVNAAAVAEGRLPNMDPDLQRALANTYAAIRKDPNTYTAEWADAQVRQLAANYNLPPNQLQQSLAEVWRTEESAKQSLMTGAKQAAEAARKRDEKVAEVTSILASGKGLNDVTGSIDGVPAKQWAVRQRTRELQKQAMDAVPQYKKDGLTDLEAIRKAAGVAEDLAWREFMQHGGVVDEDLAGSVTAGASGVLVEAGGKVNEDAREALDTWLRLKQVDPTGAYASKYTQTDQSRNMLMLAEKFYTGGYDLDSALRKAGEFISTGLSDPPDITKTTNFNRKLETQLRANFEPIMGAQGWFETSKVRMGDRAYALSNDGAQAQLRSAISAKAWAYFAAEPQNDTDVILKKAAQDVIKDSVIIGGNVLTPRAAGGTPILDQMGLRYTDKDGNTQSYPQDAASEAVDLWVQKFAEDRIADVEAGLPDDTGWARQYKQRRGGRGIFRTNTAGGLFRDNNPIPPYYASWDQDSGTLTIQLWDNEERKSTVPYELAKPIHVDLAQVGEYYRKQKEAEGPSLLQQAWRSIWGASN
ncbi:endolysin [Agrobacterium phage Atu_ph03]|uniref:Cell wall hydrolyse n=1 Tax=Agrobacterium phage Atu_ph03 TaxID=2024262 RepID=A0A223VZZ4_9CAUD|nr:endolysin [Agrobacterium phage Atu_ph03]ASV44586.1 cell wall hydrolyse [Agrobacterium phage Atu_ph03]